MKNIFENSIYSDSSQYADKLNNHSLVADMFYVNFIGGLSLYNTKRDEAIVKNYFKSEGKVQLANISDTNNDMSIVLKMASEAGLIRSTTTDKLTRLLFRLKNLTVDNIDGTLVLDIIKSDVSKLSQNISPKLKKSFKDFASGELVLNKVLEDIAPLVRIRKDEFGEMFNFIHRLKIKEQADDVVANDVKINLDAKSVKKLSTKARAFAYKVGVSLDDSINLPLDLLWKEIRNRKSKVKYEDITPEVIQRQLDSIASNKVEVATIGQIIAQEISDPVPQDVVRLDIDKNIKDILIKFYGGVDDFKPYIKENKIKITNFNDKLFEIFNKLKTIETHLDVGLSKNDIIEIANIILKNNVTKHNFTPFYQLKMPFRKSSFDLGQLNTGDKNPIGQVNALFVTYAAMYTGDSEYFKYISINSNKINYRYYEYLISDKIPKIPLDVINNYGFFNRYDLVLGDIKELTEAVNVLRDTVTYNPNKDPEITELNRDVGYEFGLGWLKNLQGLNNNINLIEKIEKASFERFDKEHGLILDTAIIKSLRKRIESLFVILKNPSAEDIGAKIRRVIASNNTVETYKLLLELSVDDVNTYQDLFATLGFEFFSYCLKTAALAGDFSILDRVKILVDNEDLYSGVHNTSFEFLNTNSSVSDKFNELYPYKIPNNIDILKEFFENQKYSRPSGYVYELVYANVMKHNPEDLVEFTISLNTKQVEARYSRNNILSVILKIFIPTDYEYVLDKIGEANILFTGLDNSGYMFNRVQNFSEFYKKYQSVFEATFSSIAKVNSDSYDIEFKYRKLGGEKPSEIMSDLLKRSGDNPHRLYYTILNEGLLIDVLKGDSLAQHLKEGFAETIIRNREYAKIMLEAIETPEDYKLIKETLGDNAYSYEGFKWTHQLIEIGISLGLETPEAKEKFIEEVFEAEVMTAQTNDFGQIRELFNYMGFAIEHYLLKGDFDKIEKLPFYEKKFKAVDGLYLFRQWYENLVNEEILENSNINELLYSHEIQPFEKEISLTRIAKILDYNDIKLDRSIMSKPTSLKTTVQRLKSKKKDLGIDEEHLVPVQAENANMTIEELEQMSVEYSAFTAGKHGDVAIKMLKVFNVNDSLTGEFYEGFKNEYYDTLMHPVWHGTGSIAATMILKYGFAIIDPKDPSAVGRMLGNGIYFSDKIDKVAQYVGDEGYSRSHGQLGYIFEMEAITGKKGTHHSSAGLESGDGIRSPEWCVFNPGAQLSIKRAFLVELTSTKYIKQLKRKYLTEGYKPLVGFKQFFTESVDTYLDKVKLIFTDKNQVINSKGDIVDVYSTDLPYEIHKLGVAILVDDVDSLEVDDSVYYIDDIRLFKKSALFYNLFK